MRVIAVLLLSGFLAAGCGRTVDPATAVQDARALLEQGRPGEARILLKNALAKQPTLAQARIVLAQIALDEGDPRAARDELSAADIATLALPKAVVVRVRVARAFGEYEEAWRLLEEAGSAIAQPEHSILRSEVLLAQGQSAQALALLREAQRTQPGSQRLTVEIARTLAAMGNLASGIAELNRHLESGPQSGADALRTRGELHLRQGAPADAMKDFEAALAAAPADWPRINRITTELMMGDAMLAAGEIARARDQIGKIQKEWPGMRGTELLGAQLALLEGRPGEAADRMIPLAETDPDNLRLQYLLVDALVKSGNPVRAIELLERRVREDPESSSARNTLASLYMRQGRPDRVIDLLGGSEAGGELLSAARLSRQRTDAAISVLTERLRQNPDNERLRAQLAMAQSANGDPARALQTLGPMPLDGWIPESAAARMTAVLALNGEFESNRLVERLLDPGSGAGIAVLLATADVAYRAGQTANASRLLDSAARLEPENVDVRLRRASLAFDARRFDEAERTLRAIVEADPAMLSARVALARLLEARGDADSARRILASAVETATDTPEPALMLAALELRAGRPAEASEVLDRLIGTADGDGFNANAAGQLLAEGGRLDEARTRFRQAVDREPDNAGYWYNLGQAQLALSDRPAARESFVTSATLQPDAFAASAAAIRLGLELRDVASARRVVDALAGALPQHPAVALMQGEVALAEGRAAQAGQAYARSYALRPSAGAAMGEFLARAQQRSPRADEPLQKWLAREPGDLATRRVLSEFYLSGGFGDQAARQLEIMLEQAPNDVVTLNNLAWLLRDRDPVRAEHLAVQARAIAPDSAAVADTLGTILLATGKYAAAVDALKQASEGLPENNSVQATYAEAQRRLRESQ